jgi:hypothetical protein
MARAITSFHTARLSASNFHSIGIHFDNGYQSPSLARILESLMQHQTAFSLPADLGRQGLLQLSAPTPQESLAATTSVNEALSLVG